MRITVDGEPIDDPDRSSADIQRCTDVALDSADIQFRFDNSSRARGSASRRIRATVLVQARGVEGPAASPVRFRMYANYSHFIDRAEVRIFERDQST